MAESGTISPVQGGVALLERAVGYTLGSLLLVTPTAMSRQSPCRDWDLRALLAHMNDSLAALHEAADLGAVALRPVVDPIDHARDPVGTLRDRACRLLGAWANDHVDRVAVGGLPMAADFVTAAGALELAVHGWDVAAACGHPHPMPAALAEDLLECAAVFVLDIDRPLRFAEPVSVPPTAGPEHRLLAFVGRSPIERR